jgi:hypothetical protein
MAGTGRQMSSSNLPRKVPSVRMIPANEPPFYFRISWRLLKGLKIL